MAVYQGNQGNFLEALFDHEADLPPPRAGWVEEICQANGIQLAHTVNGYQSDSSTDSSSDEEEEHQQPAAASSSTTTDHCDPDQHVSDHEKAVG
jgi:hypothetical protein